MLTSNLNADVFLIYATAAAARSSLPGMAFAYMHPRLCLFYLISTERWFASYYFFYILLHILQDKSKCIVSSFAIICVCAKTHCSNLHWQVVVFVFIDKKWCLSSGSAAHQNKLSNINRVSECSLSLNLVIFLHSVILLCLCLFTSLLHCYFQPCQYPWAAFLPVRSTDLNYFPSHLFPPNQPQYIYKLLLTNVLPDWLYSSVIVFSCSKSLYLCIFYLNLPANLQPVLCVILLYLTALASCISVQYLSHETEVLSPSDSWRKWLSLYNWAGLPSVSVV